MTLKQNHSLCHSYLKRWSFKILYLWVKTFILIIISFTWVFLQYFLLSSDLFKFQVWAVRLFMMVSLVQIFPSRKHTLPCWTLYPIAGLWIAILLTRNNLNTFWNLTMPHGKKEAFLIGCTQKSLEGILLGNIWRIIMYYWNRPVSFTECYLALRMLENKGES